MTKTKGRYQIFYFQWQEQYYTPTFTNDPQEAIKLAQELDAKLDYGDNGISGILDNKTGREFLIGNGHYKEGDSKVLEVLRT